MYPWSMVVRMPAPSVSSLSDAASSAVVRSAISSQIRSLAAQGVKEVTLLGQIVDRYGKDIPDGANLAGLLRVVHEVEGIERIRFLTSHPNYFGEDLMDAVAELPKVMPHIEVPIQAGDDGVLLNMKRGYTQNEYRTLVENIAPGFLTVPLPLTLLWAFRARRKNNLWKPIASWRISNWMSLIWHAIPPGKGRLPPAA